MQIPKLGDTVAGRFELTDELGRGGFGVVYKATQIGMNRPVALKVLLPQAASVETVAERFTREAQLAKNLVHPNTIQLFDFGETDGGCLYIAMEYLEGETLDQLLKREGQLPMERVVHMASQILKSLSEAHEHGIVHRDLKPANIFLRELVGEKDFVKVLDFGIAKALNLDGVEEEKLTQTGSSFGTPSYMAPEQIRGLNLGPHTDLYALALIMVKMLTGQTAVEGGTPIETAALQLSANAVPIPDWVAQSPLGPVINKALAKDVTDRYQLAIEMLTDLQRVAAVARGHVPGMPTGQMYPGGMTPPSGQLVYSGQYDYNSLQLSGPVPMPPPQQSGSGWKVALLVILMLLVTGGAVGAYLLLGQESKEKSAEAQESNSDSDNNDSSDSSETGYTDEEMQANANGTAGTDSGETNTNNEGTAETADGTGDGTGDETVAGDTPEGDNAKDGDSTDEGDKTDDGDKADKGEETAAVEMVEIEVKSSPTGAIVREGKTLLGTTPLKAKFEVGSGVHQLEVSGPGLVSEVVDVDADDPKGVTVKLKRERTAAASPEEDAKRRERRQKKKDEAKKKKDEAKKKDEPKEKKTVIPLPD